MVDVHTPVRPAGLAQVLADALDGPGPAGHVASDRDPLPGLRELLDDAARGAAAIGGWTDAEPLRLSKHLVTGLLRCPRRALADDGARSDEIVIGLIVDAAAKLAATSPRQPLTLEATLGFLAALGETTVADHLDSLAGAHDGARPLIDEARARLERLADAWPAIDPAWWPRIEEPVRVRLGGGAVTVAGRLDVLLGGPPTDRPAVVVEVKGGRWYDGMRADGHLYALLVALRDGQAPVAAVTVVADGTTQVEPIRPSVLDHAADRLVEAIRVAAGLAAGEPPATRPGGHCQHCPVRPDCPPGLDWRPEPEQRS
ncbi:MAG: PD-(D/E)XK nuclease family protein [Acidimicrobiales bacterium]